VKYPILVVAGALALIAADPTPPPPPPTFAPISTAAPASSTAPVATGVPSSSPAATPTPPPPTLDTIMGGGKKKRPAASPGPSPTPDVRKGLDGVWEVQIQRGENTDYEHFAIKQDGSSLTGTYLTKDKKKYPVAGSLDGSNVRLVVSLPDGTTILLEARVDGTTDMLGMFTDAKERVPFTAAYRPKEKWIENINASPGGLGGNGGYVPPV